VPTIAKLIASNETLKRHAVVPAYRAFARSNVFFPGPRVFANSIPKAGTHLIASLLGRLPRMMFSGVHSALGDIDGPAGADWPALERALGHVNRGQYATGHFPHDPDLVALLDRLEYASLFCLRDPRDIVVSQVNYVTGLAGHDLHRRYTQALHSFDERLMASITGFAADEYGRGLEPIGTRVERYVPWLSEPRTLVVRFEQLVGPAGGGSQEAQREAVRRVAGHVGRSLVPERLDEVCEHVWSAKSSTFHSGRTGGWRERFRPEHIEAFKRVCGQTLVELGYERNLDW
jgi:hypothetical protein